MRRTLTLQLLALLRESQGFLVPEATLRLDLRVQVSPAPTTLELSAAINTCQSRGWTVSVQDDATNQVKWKITDLGLAVLAEHGV